MDEKALLDLYNRAVSKGYKKSLDQFKNLIATNQEVLIDSYKYAQSRNYKKSIDEFSVLVGAAPQTTETEEPKKKEESASTATEQASASESQQPQETTTSGTSQPVQVELPQFDVYERDATRVDQPIVTFDQPEFGQRVFEPIKPYDPFEVTPLERDRTTVSQQGLVVDTDPMSEITKTIGQIEPVEEQQTFAPSPISRPRVAPQMVAPTLTEQDIADLEQSRKEQAEAEARTKLIELGQPDAEEIIQPDAAPADATGVVRPELVIPEEREITIQELAGRQTPSDPSPFEPAAVDATFSQTAADIAKIDPSEEAVQKRIEEKEKEFAADQLKRQLGIFSFEDNTLIEDIFGKNTVTDFIGDIYRSAGQGQAQGAVVDDAIALMRKGPNATDADIMQFIEAYNRMLESGVSDEMEDFNKIYEESGGGLVGFWNGFKSNPSVFPQLFVSSASAMFNPASLVAGVAAAGPGFLAAGPGGALVFGIGGVSSALEAALTYAELLQEEIGVNTPMTIENVRAVLSQPGIQDRLTWKSTGRGLTIGAIEAFTAALGVKATSLVTGRTGSQLVGGLTGTAVEGAGGATGEFLGRKVAGQEDDFLEVAFEGTVGGITTAPFTVTRGLIDARNKGEYKINDGVATQEQVISLLETGTDADIAGTKLDIQNDPELRKAAEDAKARVRNNAEIKAELAQAGVIDNNKADAIVPLEVEKQGLSGNTTEAGKRRLKEINDQINSILDEPTEVTTETEAVRIYEGKDKNGNTKQVKLTTQESGRIRLDIVNDDGSTSLIGDFPAESTDTDVVSGIIDTDQDFNIVKPEDAIQESSTETVDVQEPARDSEAVGEGDATGPVTTEVETEVQVEETPSTVSEEAAALREELGIAEAAPVAEETTPATEKQKAGYNKRIEKGIRDANKATTTKKKAAALQTIITNTTAIKERHGESFVTAEQQAEIDRLTQELADEGAQISEDVQKGKKVIVGQIIEFEIRKEDDTLPIGTTVIETVNTPELFDSEGNLVQRGNVDVRVGTRKLTQAEADAKIAEIEKKREQALNTMQEAFHEAINENADADIAEVRKNTEAAPTTETAPAVTEETTVAETTTEAAPAVTEEATVTEETTVTEEPAPAPKESKQAKKIKENQEDIDRLESDISYSENRIEDLELEIELEKGNTKEEKKNFAAKRAAIKDLDISREEKAERREELKFEQEDFVEDQKALIQGYKEDISGKKSDIKAAQRKIKKLQASNEKLQAGTRMQRATAPTSTDNLTITGVEETVSESQNNLIKLTENAAKAISKVLPDTKFIYHRSEQSYNNAVSENAQGSQGAYIPRTNTIHINGVKANNRTAAHEAFHALLKNKIGSDPKIEAATKKMIVTVRQSVKDKSVQAELDNFIAQYDQRFQDEEYLSELMGMLSQNYTKLNAPEKSTIRKWIESIARLFGLDKIFNIDSDQGVIDLLNVVSQRIQEGKALEEAEVGTIQSQIEGQERQQQTPAQQVARLAAMYNIEESGFLSQQINPGILRPQLRRLGYDLKKERFGYSIRDGRGKMYKPPTGRGRMQRGSIVPAEVQSKNVAGTKVPKGLSIRSVDGQRVVEGVDNMSVAKVREASPLTFIKNANFLRELDLVKGSKKFRPLPIPKSEKALRLMSPAKRRALLKRADEIYDTFVKQVSDNLVFIHDLYGDEFREISTLWYDGANQIAQGLAEKHNVSLEQASGILAALSPQKDWYQNVRLAELVLEQYDTNPVFTQEALDFQKEINERGLKAALKKGKGRLTEKGKKNKADAEQLIIELEGLIGKRLKDVEPKYQPYILRTTQEITGQKDYQIVSPDGERVGIAKKNDGTNAKVAWGSYVEIGKAVAIYLNGSPESISTQLGTAHKIRNFYDNIVDPMSDEGEVTMDTHAVAAATLLPLSGNSVEVAQNFGQGPVSSSNAAGVSGLYYAYADAYADAAKRTGLLPRQMQSVTWEAVRGLFTDSFKNSKKNVNDVRNIFSNYAQGKISIDEARKQAVDRAGGIQDPSWAGSLLSDVTRDIEAESDIRGVRRDERSDERSRIERGREVDSQRDVRSERDDLTEGAERLQKSIRKEANAIDVINRAREMKKISAAAIREVLTTSIKDKESDKFLSVAQANALLELEFETALPRSFAEINISDGISLLQKINEYKKNLDSERKSLEKENKSSISKKEKLTERLEGLDGKPDTKANKEKQSQLTSEIKDLNREIREQNKKLKDLTPTKIKSRTLLFLEAQPEYQKLADKGRTTRSTQQQKLYVDTTESLKAPKEKLPKGVPAQIRKMKSDIRQRAKGAKDLQSVKQELKNYISKNLPKVLFSRAEVNLLLTQLNRVKRTTLDLFISEVQIMLDNKEKQVLIKKITDIVKKKASKQITKSGKERSKGLDARGQQFFAAVRSILNLSVTQNRTDKVVAENQKKLQEKIQKLQQPEVEVAGEKINVKDTLNKESKNEKLSQRENALINQMLAVDLFADIENKSVDEVRELLKSLEDVRSESIKKLMSNRRERANRRDALATEATLEIKEDRPILFDEEGNLKNKNQLEFDRREIWESFNKGKIWTGVDKWVKQYPLTTGIGIAELFKKHLSHLNTLMNIIDNLPRGNNFFTENVYNRVNKMHTEHLRGTQEVRDVDLNDLANKVDGIEGGYKGLIKSIPQGAREFIINGKKRSLTVGELMSINALSRNSVVRNKLDKMGFTDDVLNQIENEIGPQMVQFISNVVEWLSTSYHQTIDDVYVKVNDVNLAVIPNYFPTSTLGENVADLVSDGDFAGVFNAEYFSAFKRRTDTDGVVEIVNRDFFDVLETYIDEMERFKAYAEGTKILNDIFKVPAVRTLMDETGIKKSATTILNIAINPKSGLNSSISSKVIGNALEGYTSYVLSFKFIQLPKQATSFIQNYEQYVYSKDGKRRLGVDMLGFAADTLKVFANFRSVFKDAYNLSPDFRDRWEQGMKGDVYGLETGGRLRKFESVSKASRKYRQAINTTRMAAASPTILGDIAGVLPAMATYYRNIENGMPQDQALRIFADYNATQQSRRTADKTSIQLSQNELTRVYTMFGSVTLLQLNKVMMAMNNLMKTAKIIGGIVIDDSKKNLSIVQILKNLPKNLRSKVSRDQLLKDVRSITLNLGVANVLFYTMANIARLHGDDEDKEAVLDILAEALIGMNLIYQIPLVGDGAQRAMDKVRDKPYRFREKPNPYSLIFRLLVKDAEETKELNLTKPAEVLLGINLDPFVALYNYAGLSGDPGEMDDLYTILGISPSYRPGGGRKKSKPKSTGRGSRSGRGGRSTRR
jgi:hypothetical protein